MPPKNSVIEVLCDTYSSIAESDPRDALQLVEHIDDCTKPNTKLQGHNKECHVDPHAYGSKLLYLRRLAPHFPNIRTIVNMLYTVRKTVTSIIKIDKAFETTSVIALEEIITEHREMNKRAYHVSGVALDESLIIKHHSEAIEAFNKCSLEVAKYPCISCTKLCYLREVTEICAIKKPY